MAITFCLLNVIALLMTTRMNRGGVRRHGIVNCRKILFSVKLSVENAAFLVVNTCDIFSVSFSQLVLEFG